MNLDEIKNNIKNHVGNNVEVRIYGMRNKKDIIFGIIDKVYPNLFVVKNNREVRSINYCDIATKEVVVKFL